MSLPSYDVPEPDHDFDADVADIDAERLSVLNALADRVAVVSNRRSMWADLGTRQVLMQGAQAAEVATQCTAMLVLSCLTVEAENRRSMWEDVGARESLFSGAKAADQETCKLALSAFANLAFESNRRPMWVDARTRSVLLDAAQATDYQVRRQALRAFANITEDKGSMQEIWADIATRSVLLCGAGAAEPGLREQALRSLANIAANEANDSPMWNDECTRAALISGATAVEENVREHAFRALVLMASVKANAEDMWADAEGTRAALLAGAAPAMAAGSRTHALGTLVLMCRYPKLVPQLAASGVRELFAAGRDSRQVGENVRQMINQVIDLLGEEPPAPECKQQ
eukprot:NODE_1290_length_1183_cov_347.793440.p1 GENE.NODE_1290_length_1183_cov_347.793440~~NODE_1290_length_1183_cov_347.793440.p1  ORF type:complete len:345 (+),score=16.80 NODE_1290_length_1183_cov_347.793440:113-1147(+)